jgi:hypothetical protein
MKKPSFLKGAGVIYKTSFLKGAGLIYKTSFLKGCRSNLQKSKTLES